MISGQYNGTWMKFYTRFPIEVGRNPVSSLSKTLHNERISIYSVTFNNTAIPASSAKWITTKNGSKSMEYNDSIAK